MLVTGGTTVPSSPYHNYTKGGGIGGGGVGEGGCGGSQGRGGRGRGKGVGAGGTNGFIMHAITQRIAAVSAALTRDLVAGESRVQFLRALSRSAMARQQIPMAKVENGPAAIANTTQDINARALAAICWSQVSSPLGSERTVGELLTYEYKCDRIGRSR